MQEKKQKRSIGQCKCCRLHFFDDCGNEELCEYCLRFISDYTKQVRKEVVEFIDKCFEMQKYESIWINPDKTEFSCDVSYAYEWWESFRKILLYQRQGESDAKD